MSPFASTSAYSSILQSETVQDCASWRTIMITFVYQMKRTELQPAMTKIVGTAWQWFSSPVRLVRPTMQSVLGLTSVYVH